MSVAFKEGSMLRFTNLAFFVIVCRVYSLVSISCELSKVRYGIWYFQTCVRVLPLAVINVIVWMIVLSSWAGKKP